MNAQEWVHHRTVAAGCLVEIGASRYSVRRVLARLTRPRLGIAEQFAQHRTHEPTLRKRRAFRH